MRSSAGAAAHLAAAAKRSPAASAASSPPGTSAPRPARSAAACAVPVVNRLQHSTIATQAKVRAGGLPGGLPNLTALPPPPPQPVLAPLESTYAPRGVAPSTTGASTPGPWPARASLVAGETPAEAAEAGGVQQGQQEQGQQQRQQQEVEQERQQRDDSGMEMTALDLVLDHKRRQEMAASQRVRDSLVFGRGPRAPRGHVLLRQARCGDARSHCAQGHGARGVGK